MYVEHKNTIRDGRSTAYKLLTLLTLYRLLALPTLFILLKLLYTAKTLACMPALACMPILLGKVLLEWADAILSKKSYGVDRWNGYPLDCFDY